MFNLFKSKDQIRREKYRKAGLTSERLVQIWRSCLPVGPTTAENLWKTEDWIRAAQLYGQKIQEIIHFDHDDKFDFELGLQRWSSYYEDEILPKSDRFTADDIRVAWEQMAVAILLKT